ncbi:hypothetical protein ACTXG6_40350 [Pseudonocardia sp. Cha107L01]|uniref:hypothetical protein n=1 Tax=Pseudonocardia sp. Cha107L01 TaxID=3457576 RepID=UPI00403E90B9
MTSAQYLWLAYDFQGHQWLADWIAGIGQAAGAVGTFVAVVVALGAGRRAQRLRDEDRADRDAAQARMISVHVVDRFSPDAVPTNIRTSEHEQTISIRNDSLEPVFRAGVIDMRLADEPQDGRHRWELVPNLAQTARRQVIEPGGSAKFDVRYFDSAGEIAWPEGDMIVSIEFRDSRGLVWRRDNDDEPVRKKQ